MTDHCAYCKKEITFDEYANSKANTIDIKNLQGEKEEVWLHDKDCLTRYTEDKKLFQCDWCYDYGYLSERHFDNTFNPKKDPKCEYLKNNELFYHKKCAYMENFCYDCKKSKDSGLFYNFIATEEEKIYVQIGEDKTVVFHKECIKDDIFLCGVCKSAYRRVCENCPYGNKFAYGCYGGCEYGWGDYSYCDYCI